MTAKGVHPVVQFVDIRSEGERCYELIYLIVSHISGLGKSFLWELFSIDHINDSLRQISAASMAYADFSLDIPSVESIPPAPESQFSEESFTFDFGATPVG